jgi:hypothetical protein
MPVEIITNIRIFSFYSSPILALQWHCKIPKYFLYYTYILVRRLLKFLKQIARSTEIQNLHKLAPRQHAVRDVQILHSLYMDVIYMLLPAAVVADDRHKKNESVGEHHNSTK